MSLICNGQRTDIWLEEFCSFQITWINPKSVVKSHPHTALTELKNRSLDLCKKSAQLAIKLQTKFNLIWKDFWIPVSHCISFIERNKKRHVKLKPLIWSQSFPRALNKDREKMINWIQEESKEKEWNEKLWRELAFNWVQVSLACSAPHPRRILVHRKLFIDLNFYNPCLLKILSPQLNFFS